MCKPTSQTRPGATNTEGDEKKQGCEVVHIDVKYELPNFSITHPVSPTCSPTSFPGHNMTEPSNTVLVTDTGANVNSTTDTDSTSTSTRTKVEFKPYDSISNRVGVGLTEEATDPTVTWLVTPKIDGTNMSVTITRPTEADPKTRVRYGRRNAFLKPDEKFYDYDKVMTSLAKWRDLLTEFPDSVHTVTVFGELYGGGYKHPDVKPVKPALRMVQSTVQYAPDKRFVAFDIRTNNSDFLPFAAAADILDRHQVPRVQVVFSGTFAEATAWATEHRSDPVNPAWYQLRDLPIIADNFGEGWVVRPDRELQTTFRDRCIYKIKNPTFSEGGGGGEGAGAGAGSGSGSGSGPGSKTKTLLPTSTIVTAARVSNVLGKELPATLTFKNIKALADLVVADAHKDFGDAVEPVAVTTTTSTGLVREYLSNLAKK
jgi:Rnl2 family RNA ligase